MRRYHSEQQVVGELVSEFGSVPARIVERILHAYLETTPDLRRAADATRHRLSDALRHE